MHGVSCFTVIMSDGMARLMISGQLLFLFRYHTALLLGTCDHLDAGLFNVSFRNGLAAALCRQQRRFIDKVFQISACEANR